MHPIEEKVYKFDNHKKNPVMFAETIQINQFVNQFPLCDQCQDEGW